MSFINLSLLLGLCLVVLPVVLHLMLRSRPKRIEFPALRLLQQRQVSNARRLRLRHLLLLALRVLLLGVLVLALARPSLPPANYALVWYEWLLLLGVAAVIVTAWLWWKRRVRTGTSTAFVQQEQLSRGRSLSVIAGLLAAVVVVGLPWGWRVRGEIRDPGSALAENLPVAAVLAFDTSLSMSYRWQGQTRLDQAREFADAHLTDLPQGSRVAVADSRPEADLVFQADLSGARSRLESLKLHSAAVPLNQLLRRAIQEQVTDRERMLAETGGEERFSRELYVFSDLSTGAWRVPDEGGLRDLLTSHEWLQVYLVDVSVEDPINLSLRSVRLSSPSGFEGDTVGLTVDVSGTEAAPNIASVEVVWQNEDGTESRPTAPETVRLPEGAGTARFQLPVPQNVDYQAGLVRLETEDPLAMDDVRYFSVGVQPQPRILLVADHPDESRYLALALQPDGSGRQRQAVYDCRRIPTSQFQQQNLSDFDLVILQNCVQPDDDLWLALKEWVSDGGALWTILGGDRRLNLPRWSSAEAEDLLPATPLTAVRFRPEPRQLTFPDSHPLSYPFDNDVEARTDLLISSVWRCWAVQPRTDAQVILAYSGPEHRPALLERRVGRGRSLMLTTAVQHTSDERQQWNDLLSGWSFLWVMTPALIQHATGGFSQQRNYVSGSLVEIQLPRERRFSEYLLQRPRFRQQKAPIPPGSDSVLIDDAVDAGHYLLRGSQEGSGFRTGFAVNHADQESDLKPVAAAVLDDVLGADRFTIVRSLSELDRAVRIGRVGIEVVPVLLGLLAVVFCAEHLMAAFFYDAADVEEDAGSSARVTNA